MEEEHKSCENCKYAIQHYAKLRGRLVKLSWAIHCSNGKVQKRQFEKHWRENTVCEYWQNEEERLSNEKSNRKRLLTKISSQLTDIIMILKEEDGEKR